MSTFRAGGRRSPPNPIRATNYALGARARRRIDSLIPVIAERRQQSIATDGSQVFIWRKGAGSVPCTCSTTTSPRSTNLVVSDAGATRAERVASTLLGNDAVDVNYGRRSGTNALDDYSLDLPEAPSKLEPDHDPDFPEVVIDTLNEGDSGILDRIVQEGPFRTGQGTKCPVCFGASYVDAWKPYRGVRLVGDFSARAEYTSTAGVNIDSSQTPTRATIRRGDSVTWSLFVPRYFDSVVRVVAWDGFDRSEAATVYVDVQPVTAPSGLNPVWVEATPSTVSSLVGYGGALQFAVEATSGPVDLTHLEVLLMLGPLPLGAIPAIDVPYDVEYTDYNTVMSVELPMDAQVEQGDVVAEDKYGRLWRATSVQRKQTSSGAYYGATAEFRAVQRSEVYTPMNVFQAK